ncbi:IS256 family transposase, partial [Salmonella enterica subsp. enterica serovar Infantis]|nr:IS256 family transposase [Salmonella enterica subsp. enterica serovar Infantis]
RRRCVAHIDIQSHSIINKAVFLALGINTEGQKAQPGIWLGENKNRRLSLSRP